MGLLLRLCDSFCAAENMLGLFGILKEAATQVLALEHCRLWQVDRKRNVVVCVYHDGDDDAQNGRVLPSLGSFAGDVARNKKVVVCNAAREDSRFGSWQYKEMQERLANETRKMQAKMREDTTAAQRASQRNQEVARYQKENAMLASENERLSGKIETLMAECVGYSETIVRLDDAAQAWRGKEADVEAAAEAVRRERDQLAAQLETTQSDLEERTEMLMVFEERFAEEHAAWKRERAELEEETARLKHAASMERERAVSAAAAPGDSPTGSARGALASPRRQHAMSRARSAEVRGAATNGLHPDDPRYVEELEAEVAELRDLRVLLLEAYDQLEKDVGREIDIALQRQNRHHANLEAKVSAQDEALRQEHKRFTSMDRALSEAQDELAEASRRNAEYETGVYGLSEAMRDLKALRLQVRAADDQVRDAVETSNQLGRKVEDLTEETRFLRQKAGIPEDADIDLGAFKIRSKVEAAQLRALNAQLEREVHELEEDRRRLRNELRYRAKWQGEHAAKLGLSARQLAMLEEFADALRFGQETNFVVEGGAAEGDAFSAQRAVDNVNARAVNELEEANRHLQERLAEALERARRSGVDVDAPRVNAPVSRGADATSERSSSKKRWLTRPVYGYACVVRNERVGVKRTGLMDTNESFPTYPKSWVTALDVGEMWEICTGPRNLAGASDFDMYEYKKASGELDDDDEEEESPPGSMT